LLLDAGLRLEVVEVKMDQHHTQNLPGRLLLRELGYLMKILLRRKMLKRR